MLVQLEAELPDPDVDFLELAVNPQPFLLQICCLLLFLSRKRAFSLNSSIPDGVGHDPFIAPSLFFKAVFSSASLSIYTVRVQINLLGDLLLQGGYRVGHICCTSASHFLILLFILQMLPIFAVSLSS